MMISTESGAFNEAHLETRGLSSILSFRSLLIFLHSALSLLECLPILFSMLYSGITINLLSLSCKSLTLHDRIVDVPQDRLILLLQLLVHLSSLQLCLLLLLLLQLSLLLSSLLNLLRILFFLLHFRRLITRLFSFGYLFSFFPFRSLLLFP